MGIKIENKARSVEFWELSSKQITNTAWWSGAVKKGHNKHTVHICFDCIKLISASPGPGVGFHPSDPHHRRVCAHTHTQVIPDSDWSSVCWGRITAAHNDTNRKLVSNTTNKKLISVHVQLTLHVINTCSHTRIKQRIINRTILQRWVNTRHHANTLNPTYLWLNCAKTRM